MHNKRFRLGTWHHMSCLTTMLTSASYHVRSPEHTPMYSVSQKPMPMPCINLRVGFMRQILMVQCHKFYLRPLIRTVSHKIGCNTDVTHTCLYFSQHTSRSPLGASLSFHMRATKSIACTLNLLAVL